jgi:DNA-directed RNA polymerase specialized sigma24 family protein
MRPADTGRNHNEEMTMKRERITTWADARAALVRACSGRGMSREDAEDAAQDIVIRHLSAGREPTGVLADMLSIVRRGPAAAPAICREIRRSRLIGRTTWSDAIAETLVSHQPGPETVAMAHELGIVTD